MELSAMTNWIAVHIPEKERGLISLWIGGRPITGATLVTTLRTLPIYGVSELSEIVGTDP